MENLMNYLFNAARKTARADRSTFAECTQYTGPLGQYRSQNQGKIPIVTLKLTSDEKIT